MRAMSSWLTVTPITECKASMIKLIIKPSSIYPDLPNDSTAKKLGKQSWNSFLASIVNTEEVQCYLINSNCPAEPVLQTLNENLQQVYYFWPYCFCVSGALKCLTSPVKGTKLLQQHPPALCVNLVIGHYFWAQTSAAVYIQLHHHLRFWLKYSLTLKLVN